MKTLCIIVALVCFSFSCDKDVQYHREPNDREPNNVVLSMNYSTNLNSSKIQTKQASNSNDTLYTIFGDYITSITPSRFIGKFLDMRLLNYSPNTTQANYGFNVIDNNTPIDSINRLADFSNNGFVNFNLIPIHLPEGSYAEFNIFVFILLYFYQEFDLPSAYNSVPLLEYLPCNENESDLEFTGHWIAGVRNQLHIKMGSDPMFSPIFDTEWQSKITNTYYYPKCYVFGSSDSTYMYFSHISHQSQINNPIGQEGHIICSNAFNKIQLQLDSDKEQTMIEGYMTFDTRQLIQVYCGPDNIPYTHDDVFVYAPRFWERISVHMNSK